MSAGLERCLAIRVPFLGDRLGRISGPPEHPTGDLFVSVVGFYDSFGGGISCAFKRNQVLLFIVNLTGHTDTISIQVHRTSFNGVEYLEGLNLARAMQGTRATSLCNLCLPQQE